MLGGQLVTGLLVLLFALHPSLTSAAASPLNPEDKAFVLDELGRLHKLELVDYVIALDSGNQEMPVVSGSPVSAALHSWLVDVVDVSLRSTNSVEVLLESLSEEQLEALLLQLYGAAIVREKKAGAAFRNATALLLSPAGPTDPAQIWSNLARALSFNLSAASLLAGELLLFHAEPYWTLCRRSGNCSSRSSRSDGVRFVLKAAAMGSPDADALLAFLYDARLASNDELQSLKDELLPDDDDDEVKVSEEEGGSNGERIWGPGAGEHALSAELLKRAASRGSLIANLALGYRIGWGAFGFAEGALEVFSKDILTKTSDAVAKLKRWNNQKVLCDRAAQHLLQPATQTWNEMYSDGAGAMLRPVLLEELYLEAGRANALSQERKVGDWFRNEALAGDVEAQRELGEMEFYGDATAGVAQAPVQGLERLHGAAQLGSGGAHATLGSIYVNGHGGVNQSNATALVHFNAAAKQGLPSAFNGLGFMHLNGMGTPVNASAAFEQFSLAAADGYGEAYSNLGYLHLEGLGTPRNLTAAFEAYKLSYEYGFTSGEFNVARFYLNGWGTEKDCPRALRLLKHVAESGTWLRDSLYSPEQAYQQFMRVEGLVAAAPEAGAQSGARAMISGALASMRRVWDDTERWWLAHADAEEDGSAGEEASSAAVPLEIAVSEALSGGDLNAEAQGVQRAFAAGAMVGVEASQINAAFLLQRWATRRCDAPCRAGKAGKAVALRAAAALLELAANQSSPVAQRELGHCAAQQEAWVHHGAAGSLREGPITGCDANLTLAHEHYADAADGGDSEARFHLALLVASEGALQNRTRAVELLLYGSGDAGAPSWPAQIVLTLLRFSSFAERELSTNQTWTETNDTWTAAFVQANALLGIEGTAQSWMFALAFGALGTAMTITFMEHLCGRS